jgi:hypothetical protein
VRSQQLQRSYACGLTATTNKRSVAAHCTPARGWLSCERLLTSLRLDAPLANFKATRSKRCKHGAPQCEHGGANQLAVLGMQLTLPMIGPPRDNRLQVLIYKSFQSVKGLTHLRKGGNALPGDAAAGALVWPGTCCACICKQQGNLRRDWRAGQPCLTPGSVSAAGPPTSAALHSRNPFPLVAVLQGYATSVFRQR